MRINRHHLNKSGCVKQVLFTMVLVGLMGLPLFAEKDKSVETHYYAVMINQQKSGHMVLTRTEEDDRVTHRIKTLLSISRMGIPIKITTIESCTETTDGKPLGFTSIQELSGMRMSIRGEIKNGKTINITTESAGSSQTQTMLWPEGALLEEGASQYMMKKGLKAGTEYDMNIFSPTTLDVMPVHVQVGPKLKIDLLGRITWLHEVITEIKNLGGGITNYSYVNEDGDVQKFKMNVMGIQMEMLACDKSYALAEDVRPAEFFNQFIIRSPKPLNNLDKIKSITYTIKSRSAAPLNFPETDSQHILHPDPCTYMVTVTPPVIPAGITFPCNAQAQDIRAAMKPAPYLQTDNPKLKQMARQAIGDAVHAGPAVRNIERFVSRHIREKNLSVGYASALEVMQSQEGDCSEHAVLTAALCRAVGIPAQVVFGVVYVPWQEYGKDGIFGPHAWARAYVGDTWIGLDATGAPRGYSCGHIILGFGNGNMTDYFDTINTLGQFQIVDVDIQQKQ